MLTNLQDLKAAVVRLEELDTEDNPIGTISLEQSRLGELVVFAEHGMRAASFAIEHGDLAPNW